MLERMEAFLVSAGMVALAEIGDKTQLLAIVLAARYRQPAPLVAGILLATLANHALAGLVGQWVMSAVGPATLRAGLALAFLAMAIWVLIPDRVDDDGPRETGRFGVFGTTIVAFFLAEMGDKTQIATVALAARYNAVVTVVAGTTVGMLLANVPAVFLGHRLSARLPLRLLHGIAAGLFALLAALVWRAPPNSLTN